jgi:hypothetical protein
MNSAQAGSYILSYVTLALILLFPVWISKTTQNFLNSKYTPQKKILSWKNAEFYSRFFKNKNSSNQASSSLFVSKESSIFST